jgi:hypothetical protein
MDGWQLPRQTYPTAWILREDDFYVIHHLSSLKRVTLGVLRKDRSKTDLGTMLLGGCFVDRLSVRWPTAACRCWMVHDSFRIPLGVVRAIYAPLTHPRLLLFLLLFLRVLLDP